MEKTVADWLEWFAVKDREAARLTEYDLAESLRKRTTSCEVVRELLRNPDTRVREEVAWALQEANKAEWLPVIYDGLNDPYVGVRYWCVLALRYPPSEHRLAATVRVLILLEDEDDRIRDAAADIMYRRQSGDFLASLAADPSVFDLGPEKAATVRRIQQQLRIGYGELPSPLEGLHADRSFEGLAEMGYGFRVGHEWSLLSRLVARVIPILNSDGRAVIAAGALDSILPVLDAIRSLGKDVDWRARLSSWQILGRLAGEVIRWREDIPSAARDEHRSVRSSCFRSFQDRIDHRGFTALAEACLNYDDEPMSESALTALDAMVERAACVANIGSETLEQFVHAISDVNLSKHIRTKLRSVLQSYAEIFLRREKAIDWADVLARTRDEEPGDAANGEEADREPR